MAYQKRFKEVVKNEYKEWYHMYKDGFKSEIGVERQLALEAAQNLDHYQNLALYSQQEHMQNT